MLLYDMPSAALELRVPSVCYYSHGSVRCSNLTEVVICPQIWNQAVLINLLEGDFSFFSLLSPFLFPPFSQPSNWVSQSPFSCFRKSFHRFGKECYLDSCFKRFLVPSPHLYPLTKIKAIKKWWTLTNWVVSLALGGRGTSQIVIFL